MGQVVYVDADGVHIGDAQSGLAASYRSVWFQDGETIYRAVLASFEGVVDFVGVVYYDGPDCTGNVYMPPQQQISPRVEDMRAIRAVRSALQGLFIAMRHRAYRFNIHLNQLTLEWPQWVTTVYCIARRDVLLSDLRAGMDSGPSDRSMLPPQPAISRLNLESLGMTALLERRSRAC